MKHRLWVGLLPLVAAADFDFNAREELPSSMLEIPSNYIFPHPTAVDWDGDGDEDLISGCKYVNGMDQTSNIIYFENTGTQAAPAYEFRGELEAAGQVIEVETS